MPEITLPQKIIFGDNSMIKYADQCNFESVLIISDGGIPENLGLINEFCDSISKHIPIVKYITESNFEKLIDDATKTISNDETDRIIAIGSATLIDCAALLSYQCGVKFSAIPYLSACAATDFSEANYAVYRKMPTEVVLDPNFASFMPSAAIAYDSFSCFAYAVDSLLYGNNQNASPALTSAADILNNSVGAYRGNRKLIQKLQYSMYTSVLTFYNTFSASTPLKDITSFFSLLGVSSQVSAAICIPEIMDYYRSELPPELCKAVGLYRSGESFTDSIDRLIARVRSVQASLGIPRNIHAICTDTEIYKAFCENSHVPGELLDLCYNGSFRFMKL